MNRALQITCAVFLSLGVLPYTCTSYIGPDEFGVRRSLTSGVEDVDFLQGRILDTPLFHTVYRLPRRLHVQKFIGNDALSVRTTGNNVIEVDVAVKYRIIEGEAHKIVEEGFMDTYDDKVASIARDFLQKHLGTLSNEDTQDTDKRVNVALSAIAPLNVQLAQYHVQVVPEGVVIRQIMFRAEYEAKLQNTQLFMMQGKLDAAKQKESAATQLTDTVEKGIDKDVKLEEETWNGEIQKARTEAEIQIANVNAAGGKYDRTRRAEADAECLKAKAESDLAEAKAEALGTRLETEVLASQAGRTYSAIEAVRNFQLGDVLLNSTDPEFLQRFGSMKAWRRLFLPEE